MNSKYHGYYSKKQKEVLTKMNEDGIFSLVEIFMSIDGVVREVTYVSPSDSGLKDLGFDDVVYQGYGTLIRVDNIKPSLPNSLENLVLNYKNDNSVESELALKEFRELLDYRLGKKEYVPQWPDIIYD